MKILKVNYVSGEALFVIEEFPDMTFCVSMEGKTTKQEVIDKLKTMVPEPYTTEETYNNLKLKDLEGTDI